MAMVFGPRTRIHDIWHMDGVPGNRRKGPRTKDLVRPVFSGACSPDFDVVNVSSSYARLGSIWSILNGLVLTSQEIGSKTLVIGIGLKCERDPTSPVEK